MTKLTKAQRTRLDKLATYLEGLPKRYRHFDMATITNLSSEQDAEYGRKNGGLAKYDCGAVACAVGHGPAAGVLVPPGLITTGVTSRWVDWHGYARLFTGNRVGLWDWLFSGNWDVVDNGHRGAAARLRYLLAHESPPSEFRSPDRKWRKAYAPYRIDAKVPA